MSRHSYTSELVSQQRKRPDLSWVVWVIVVLGQQGLMAGPDVVHGQHQAPEASVIQTSLSSILTVVELHAECSTEASYLLTGLVPSQMSYKFKIELRQVA